MYRADRIPDLAAPQIPTEKSLNSRSGGVPYKVRKPAPQAKSSFFQSGNALKNDENWSKIRNFDRIYGFTSKYLRKISVGRQLYGTTDRPSSKSGIWGAPTMGLRAARVSSPTLIKSCQEFLFRGSQNARRPFSGKWLVGPRRTSDRATSFFIRLGNN